MAEDNSRFDENGRKISKRAENTMLKGESARNDCFQKTSTSDTYKPGLV